MTMPTTYSYACKDYPGMENCPGHVVAETKDEVWKLMELHASIAHGEDPSKWNDEDRAFLSDLIKSS
jgi:predicted small metal-binding protein